MNLTASHDTPRFSTSVYNPGRYKYRNTPARTPATASIGPTSAPADPAADPGAAVHLGWRTAHLERRRGGHVGRGRPGRTQADWCGRPALRRRDRGSLRPARGAAIGSCPTPRCSGYTATLSRCGNSTCAFRGRNLAVAPHRRRRGLLAYERVSVTSVRSSPSTTRTLPQDLLAADGGYRVAFPAGGTASAVADGKLKATAAGASARVWIRE